MSYEAVGDYLSKTNRSPGQKAVISSSTFLLQQIAKEEKKGKKQKGEEISVERVEQIPKKLLGEEVNKEIDYVKDLLKMQVEGDSDVAGQSYCLSALKCAGEATSVFNILIQPKFHLHSFKPVVMNRYQKMARKFKWQKVVHRYYSLATLAPIDNLKS